MSTSCWCFSSTNLRLEASCCSLQASDMLYRNARASGMHMLQQCKVNSVWLSWKLTNIGHSQPESHGSDLGGHLLDPTLHYHPQGCDLLLAFGAASSGSPNACIISHTATSCWWCLQEAFSQGLAGFVGLLNDSMTHASRRVQAADGDCNRLLMVPASADWDGDVGKVGSQGPLARFPARVGPTQEPPREEDRPLRGQ